jgi:hypothetical protein
MLAEKPSIAHGLDLSLNIAKRPTRKESGGTDIMKISTRDLKREGPQPNCRIRSHNNRLINQGDRASKKLVIPNLIECIAL